MIFSAKYLLEAKCEIPEVEVKEFEPLENIKESYTIEEPLENISREDFKISSPTSKINEVINDLESQEKLSKDILDDFEDENLIPVKEVEKSEEVKTELKKPDKLYYYSRSKDLYPGKGINEFVNDPSDYKELSEIPNWRQILSNFNESIFLYKNKKYRTIEHAFQAQKILLQNPNLASEFEVGGKLDGSGEIARKNRKIIKLSDENLDKWNRMKYDVMKEITIEKYKSSEIYRKVLYLTKNSELWHIVSRGKPIHNVYLEEIRNNPPQPQLPEEEHKEHKEEPQPLESGCPCILATGKDKGKRCGRKIFNDGKCKIHQKTCLPLSEQPQQPQQPPIQEPQPQPLGSGCPCMLATGKDKGKQCGRKIFNDGKCKIHQKTCLPLSERPQSRLPIEDKEDKEEPQPVEFQEPEPVRIEPEIIRDVLGCPCKLLSGVNMGKRCGKPIKEDGKCRFHLRKCEPVEEKKEEEIKEEVVNIEEDNPEPIEVWSVENINEDELVSILENLEISDINVEQLHLLETEINNCFI